jgi:hypothetical protein
MADLRWFLTNPNEPSKGGKVLGELHARRKTTWSITASSLDLELK